MSKETDLMRATLRMSQRPGSPYRLWRQNSGTVPMADGRFFHAGPPRGVSDLSGIVRGTGWRLEIEIKGPDTPITEKQMQWLEFIESFGGVSLLYRYDPALNLETNAELLKHTIETAIGARKLTGDRATADQKIVKRIKRSAANATDSHSTKQIRKGNRGHTRDGLANKERKNKGVTDNNGSGFRITFPVQH